MTTSPSLWCLASPVTKPCSTALPNNMDRMSQALMCSKIRTYLPIYLHSNTPTRNGFHDIVIPFVRIFFHFKSLKKKGPFNFVKDFFKVNLKKDFWFFFFLCREFNVSCSTRTPSEMYLPLRKAVWEALTTPLIITINMFTKILAKILKTTLSKQIGLYFSLIIISWF